MRQIYAKFGLLLAVVGLGVSCSEPKEVRVRYDEIGGASALLSKVRSACELALVAEQAGRYRVASLTGVYEEFPIDSGIWEPRTYVELELLEGWSKSAADVTVRIQGGPFPDGSTQLHFITLRDGETIGAILNGPRKENADYRHLTIQGLFHETNGEMSNGRLQTTTSELANVTKKAIDDGECPVDIVYERPPSEQPEQVDSPPDGTYVPVNQGDAGTPDAG